MKISENIPLAQYTTFKIGGPARFFCIVSSEQELVEAINFAKDKHLRLMVLGGGSNVLISDAGFNGLVVKNEIMGIEIIQETDQYTVAKVGAGEMWDDFVDWSVDKGLYGIENLSAIPGTVGAAPVQNIGAYGAEISDVIEQVRVFDTTTMSFSEMAKDKCGFEYRDSIFKKDKGRYVVSQVVFKLAKTGNINIEYKDVKEYFEKNNKSHELGLSDVREAVVNIRWGKLPDWKLWGTAGSFFKNPVISAERYEELKKKYPELPAWPGSGGRVKVSAAWILDKICDAKNIKRDNVGVYGKQALVVVAKNGATADEVVGFSRELMDLVLEKTGIKIEAEVEWVN